MLKKFERLDGFLIKVLNRPKKKLLVKKILVDGVITAQKYTWQKLLKIN